MMQVVTQSLTALVAVLAGAGHANAGVIGERQIPLGCGPPGPWFTYDISSTVKNQLGNPVTSDWNCVGTSSCVISQGSTFTVGKTVTIGGSLDLDFEDIVAKAGITASVSITTLSGSTGSVSLSCPKGPWTCALIITPPVTVVTGEAQPLAQGCVPSGPADAFSMELPEKMGPSGIMMGGHVDVCACQNFAHWADDGAPSIVCPSACSA